MPLRIQCPCGNKLRAPDHAAGKKIKCPECGRAVAVPAEEETPGSSSPSKGNEMIHFDCEECGQAMQARASATGKRVRCPGCEHIQVVPEPDEADEDGNESPRASGIRSDRPPVRSTANSKRRREEELEEVQEGDEEEEEEPRPRRRRRSEEEDEEEEKPRKGKKGKKGKKAKSGFPLLIIAGVGVMMLLLSCGGLGVAIWFLWGGAGELANYVPGNGQGFVSVRLAEAWKQDTIQKLLQEVRKQVPPGQPDPVAEMEKQFGMNPADIERVTMVFLDAEKEQVWAVVSTLKPFDKAKIESTMKNPTKVTFEGKTYTLDNPQFGTKSAIHYVNDRMAVVGPEQGVKLALGVAKQKTPGPLDEALRILGKNHLVVAVNLNSSAIKTQDIKGKMTGMAAQFKPVAEAQLATVVMNLSTVLDTEITLKYLADPQAKAAKEALDKGVLAAKGMLAAFGFAGGAEAPEAKELMEQATKALDSIKIEQRSTQVVVKSQTEVKIPAGGIPLPGMGGPPPVRPPKKKR